MMFDAVIVSTLTGSVVALAVLIFKNKILSFFGGKALYYISLFAMLIFILPLNVGDISLPKMPAKQTMNISEFETAAPSVETAAPAENTENTHSEVRQNVLPKTSNMLRRSNPVTVQEILFAVWLLGFAVSMNGYFVSYFRFRRKICGFDVRERIDGVDVIKSPLISSPLVFGFFKPTLAIPEIEMNEDDYNLAIKHEMVHYKNHDSWFKLFAVIVNSICWFNPITYFMVGLIGEACEYACDEQVVKEMDLTGKKQYGKMILSVVCQTSPSLSSNMAKNKKQLKRRIEIIMKKKKSSVFKTALCAVLILALTCAGAVLANGAAPLVSALLKDDYVYVSTFGNGEYNRIVPVKKNGVYYLPLREFLNKSDVENDKIKFENDTITVDIWTNELTMISHIGKPNEPSEENRTTVPAAYSWSTTCKIGSRKVETGGEKYTLSAAPYIEDGITYVPYEYLQTLKKYEDNMRAALQKQTSKFDTMMMFGFESGKTEFYTDYIQMNQMSDSDSYAYRLYNSDARISKTGYRTEFEASYSYFDLNDINKNGTISVKLNKVTRIYSKGSDIEGLFTVTENGKVIYDNEKGCIAGLPIPSGEGVLDIMTTKVKIGKLQLDVFFNGFDSIPEEYNERAKEVSKMTELPDTVKKSIVPDAVKLNGISVLRGSKMYSHVWYNTEKKLIDVNIEFDNYGGGKDREMDFYTIRTEIDSKMAVIDENSISAELYIIGRDVVRLDSFDAIITFSPDGEFELKSTDGKYIIHGTAKEYVPHWQQSEEEKNSPVPRVTMIDE